MDPCQDLSDEDIWMAIQNATGPRNALFVPEVRNDNVYFHFPIGEPNDFILDSMLIIH